MMHAGLLLALLLAGCATPVPPTQRPPPHIYRPTCDIEDCIVTPMTGTADVHDMPNTEPAGTPGDNEIEPMP